MGIEVNHGVGPVVAAAGYGVGMMRGQQRYGAMAGKYAQTMLDRRDRLQARQDAVMERERGRQFQADRDVFQQYGNLLDDQRTFQNQKDVLGLQLEGYDRRNQANLQQEQIRGEYDVDQEVMNGLRTGGLELPAKALQQLQQLDAAAVEAELLGPDQQAEFQQRATEKRRALMRMARPKAIPDMTLGERFNRDTLQGDDGARYQFSEGKGWSKLSEGPGAAQQEMATKRNDSILKEFEKLRDETDENNVKVYKTDDEALKAAVEKQDALDKAREKLGGPTLPTSVPAEQAQPTEQAQPPAAAPDLRMQSSISAPAGRMQSVGGLIYTPNAPNTQPNTQPNAPPQSAKEYEQKLRPFAQQLAQWLASGKKREDLADPTVIDRVAAEAQKRGLDLGMMIKEYQDGKAPPAAAAPAAVAPAATPKTNAPDWAQQVIKDAQAKPDRLNDPGFRRMVDIAKGTKAAPMPLPTKPEAYSDANPERRKFLANLGTIQQSMRSLRAGRSWDHLSKDEQNRYLKLREQWGAALKPE